MSNSHESATSAGRADPAPTGDRDEWRQAESRMFSASAGYELYMGRWSRVLAPQHMRFAGASDGERVLDVGTGTGALAFAAAAALPASEVVGVDPSAAFVECARARAASNRPRFEVGDAQALEFEAASFDQSMALLVLNFVPDHHKALGEMCRVTRAGGVVSACVWDYDCGMQMLRFFWDEVVALDPAMETRDERHMKLCREGQLGALWVGAGLVDVHERPLVVEQSFASFDDYWGAFLKGAGPGGAYVISLDDGRRRELEARLRRRLQPGCDDGQFTLTARAWSVRGRVPCAG